MNASNRIEAKIKRLPKGKPLRLQMFRDCGSSGAVRVALSRLVKSGELAHVAYGIYARPKPNEFFGASLPAMEEVAEEIAKSTGEKLAPHGAELARRFGLSTQMSVGTAFYTTGRTRQVRAGNAYIQFEHAPERLMAEATTRVGRALLALHYLGREHISPEVLGTLNEKVPISELQESKATPAWLRTPLKAFELELSA